MELTSAWNVRKTDNLLCPPFPWWRTHPLIWGQKEANWLSGSVASCWNFKTFNSWAREMAQCVKAMVAQCGHLSWDPQNTHKKAGMAVCNWNQVPLLWYYGADRGRRLCWVLTGQILWSSQSRIRNSWYPISKEVEGQNELFNIDLWPRHVYHSMYLWHSCAPTTHTHTHTWMRNEVLSFWI